MAPPAEIRAHQEWLGFLQPIGLVVSPTALVSAQAQVDRNIAREQEALRALVREDEGDDGARRVLLPDLPAFFSQFLGWEASDLAGGPGGPELPSALDVSVPDYEDVLSPTYAVPQLEESGGWLLLIRAEAAGTPLDKPLREERRWQATPQARFERLLRANHVAIGVLTNRTQIRLVYAPPLETTGHLTFTVADLCTVAGRPLVSALL
ncbi:MAG: Eco57I restriction-modification methylase domain-containing protein, partial [Longimicrobiales bacterium]